LVPATRIAVLSKALSSRVTIGSNGSAALP